LDDNPAARANVENYLRRADWFISRYGNTLKGLEWKHYHGDVKPDSTFLSKESRVVAPDGQALIIRAGKLCVDIDKEGRKHVNDSPIVAPWPCSPPVFQAAYLLAELSVLGREHLRLTLWEKYRAAHDTCQSNPPIPESLQRRLADLAEAYRALVYVFIYLNRRQFFDGVAEKEVGEARNYEILFARRASFLADQATQEMPHDYRMEYEGLLRN